MLGWLYWILGYTEDEKPQKQTVVVNNTFTLDENVLKSMIAQLKNVESTEKAKLNYKPELLSLKQKQQKASYANIVKKLK